MTWLNDFFVSKKQQRGLKTWALELHDRLASRALALTRNEGLGIADDFPLRFEVMTLLVANHLFLIAGQQDDQSQARMQTLWETTFEGFENSLRERGVSDIRMASRMRKLFQEATGRRDAFLAALEANDQEALRRAIGRNVLNGAPPTDQRIDKLLAALEQTLD